MVIGGVREQPDLCFLQFSDPAGKADKTHRGAPAASLFRLRLGCGARLSDSSLATPRRELRQRGGGGAAAPSQGAVFPGHCSSCRNSHSQLLMPSCGLGVSLGRVHVDCPVNPWLLPQLPLCSKEQMAHSSSFCNRRRRRARRRGSWRSRRQRRSCLALRRHLWTLGDSQSLRMTLTGWC